ncbi:MAG: nucleotidyltransferase domain-containing protein [Nanoarchaeota archaeon]
MQSKKSAHVSGANAKKIKDKKINFLNEREVAMHFVEKVHEKFNKMVKASILFGSQTKKTAKPGSDIDIILVIDDASIVWDLELIAWYREELGKIINSVNKEYNRELHINTVKLTTWWQDMIYGDPVIVNILRYGEALIDSGGFFNPLKALLAQGKIKSTPEAVYNTLQRAPAHLIKSKLAEIGALEGVYWSMVDSAQAALMTAGKMPPSPEHIPEMLKETFVDKGMLKIDYIIAIRDLYITHKAIAHREINHIKGQDLDIWREKAEKFLGEMTRIINTILSEKKS